MLQTVTGLLTNTDMLICGLVLVAGIIGFFIATRGPGWFWQGICFAFGAFWMLALDIITRRLRPPIWRASGVDETKLIDPPGRTDDHPDG